MLLCGEKFTVSDNKVIKINESRIKKAIESEMPLLITTFTLSHEMELYINEVVSCFLRELNQEYMIQYVLYCVNELTSNAKKANTKRVYFQEKNLDINNEAQYNLGMQKFKQETLDDINRYLMLQKENGLYIKVLLQKRDKKMKIEVKNNSPLTIFEYKRIHDKITRAEKYTSVEEVFSQILDDSEGAGLGIIIMILMLKKIGLSDENFKFYSKDGETITKIILDLNTSFQNQINVASAEIVNSINSLPHFPENIQRINSLLNDKDSKLSDIAAQISSDVTLTTDLLKLVNSAAFSLNSPCQSILKAVQLVGIRGIKNLLYSLGTIQNLNTVNAESSKIWEHSNKVAFFSYNLARGFCASQRNIVDDSYVCGLLHDIGKVIFYSIHQDNLKQIKHICKSKNIPENIFEQICSGVNHAEIGAMITEKWNFPIIISQVVRFHHNPELATEEYKTLCEIVYLANMITHYSENIVEIYQFDTNILEKYSLDSEERLDTITKRLVTAYENGGGAFKNNLK